MQWVCQLMMVFLLFRHKFFVILRNPKNKNDKENGESRAPG